MRLNLAGRGILVIFPLNLAGGVFPFAGGSGSRREAGTVHPNSSWLLVHHQLWVHPHFLVIPRSPDAPKPHRAPSAQGKGKPLPQSMGLGTLERDLGSPSQHGDAQNATLWCHPIPAAAPSLLPQVPGPGAPGRHSPSCSPGHPRATLPCCSRRRLAAPLAKQRSEMLDLS